MIIEKSNVKKDSLINEVALVTGAGRGIGYEAAKALAWLGANVIIAEINEPNGKAAEESIKREFGTGEALFVKTDIGNEKDIDKLAETAMKKFGKVDIVLNNATVFPISAVKDTTVDSWDFSYRVNLRGPVLLARKFLPAMIERKHGVFVCVSSSGAAPFMGPYEVFKTAQVELANTVAAEVEGTGVYAFTIGPGISRTPGFIEGGRKVAAFMGMSLDELFELNKNAQISPEAAGAGFAIAIALAKRYHGQETSSIQVLREAEIPVTEQETSQEQEQKSPKDAQYIKPIENRTISELYKMVSKTYSEQSEGWKKRNLFERQWVARDFKKNTGLSIDEMFATIKALGDDLKAKNSTTEYVEPLKLLAAYYEHQQEQLKGFEKDPKKLQENLRIIDCWIIDTKQLVHALTPKA
ncbi:MAG: SDR family oxidoreductase [Candidatus Bathyarchaeia archaeon]|jgi:NAD(P)-dependent dehydrogenase (short-subunit alcohol dehydrogenase family)